MFTNLDHEGYSHNALRLVLCLGHVVVQLSVESVQLYLHKTLLFTIYAVWFRIPQTTIKLIALRRSFSTVKSNKGRKTFITRSMVYKIHVYLLFYKWNTAYWTASARLNHNFGCHAWDPTPLYWQNGSKECWLGLSLVIITDFT